MLIKTWKNLYFSIYGFPVPERCSEDDLTVHTVNVGPQKKTTSCICLGQGAAFLGLWKFRSLYLLYLATHSKNTDSETSRWESFQQLSFSANFKLENSETKSICSIINKYFFTIIKTDYWLFGVQTLINFVSFYYWHLISFLINTCEKELQPLQPSRSSWLSLSPP